MKKCKICKGKKQQSICGGCMGYKRGLFYSIIKIIKKIYENYRLPGPKH